MSGRYQSSEPANVERLGEPLQFEFSNQAAKNRFLKAAMAEQLATWSLADRETRGVPDEKLINLYKTWGDNDWGVVLTGNVDISLDQHNVGNMIIAPENPTSGPRFEAYQKLAAAGKGKGNKIIAQVVHPGRQMNARGGNDTFAASALPLPPAHGMEFPAPREATKADIQNVVDGYAHAAAYLEAAGFSGIELHGAHGYLLSNFLSESSNHRTDEYGGSLENRMRLIIEVAEAVKSRVSPSFILGIKLNSVEFQEKGFSVDEAKVVSQALERHHFDFVELSGGTYENMAFEHKKESTKQREAFFLEFADAIAPALSRTKLYVTGGLRSAAAMVKALDSVDGVGLGRPAAQEPGLPALILSGKVSGAIKPVSAVETDFGMSLATSGVQIGQIARKQQPLDASDEAVVKAFQSELFAWFGEVAKDESKFGWPELASPVKGVAATKPQVLVGTA